MIGRRGPLQATFTTLELRELGDLEAMADVDVIVDPADFADITDEDLEAAGKTVKQNIKVLRGYAEREPRGRQAPHRVPVPHLADRDQGRRTGSSRSCWAATSWSTTTGGWSPRTPASARSCPRSWWSARSATAACRRRACRSTSGPAPSRTPTGGSTAAATNTSSAGSSAGPSGVIGSNKKDSQDTVDTLLADLAGAELADFDDDHADELVEWLLSRQPKLVTDDHWKLIDAHERSAGEPHGRPRVKLTSVAELLRIGHG